jgi:hypothetical protein
MRGLHIGYLSAYSPLAARSLYKDFKF